MCRDGHTAQRTAVVAGREGAARGGARLAAEPREQRRGFEPAEVGQRAGARGGQFVNPSVVERVLGEVSVVRIGVGVLGYEHLHVAATLTTILAVLVAHAASVSTS